MNGSVEGCLESLGRLLGPKGWLTGADTAPHRCDWLDRYGVEPLGVARPASTTEVAALSDAAMIWD